MTAHPSSTVFLDRDQTWQVIGAQRRQLAGMLDELADREWDHPSLCAGWTVRDVAAHLTLQQLGARAAAGMMIRYRGDIELAVRECARRRGAAWPAAEITADIRRTAGSRRSNFGVTYRETLIDILVHAQDIAVPLGRIQPMPAHAAAAAATRIWTMRWPPPFPARRVMERFLVTASDIAWSAGRGPRVQAPIGAILLLSTGRLAALPQVSGDGAAALAAGLTAHAGSSRPRG